VSTFSLKEMTSETASASLAVNKQYEAMLSPLTMADFEELVRDSCYAKQAGDGAAFLIAFHQGSRYEKSDNFDWFKSRYKRFVYVDRIAISDHLQRQGLGQALYEDLVGFAKRRNAPVLCAEVNIDPPNPASHKFHTTMGFKPVGEAHAGGKHVQYYVKSL